MVLQHGLVIVPAIKITITLLSQRHRQRQAVHDGQLRAAVDQELVGEARVVHVVDGRGEDGGHHLQRREHALSNRKYFFGTDQIFFLCTHLQCGRVEKNVSGLSDVSAVHAVVIWNI